MKYLAALGAALALSCGGQALARAHYSGSSHSYSYGGHYSGSHGSSHRGGHYRNYRTGNHYGCHKCR